MVDQEERVIKVFMRAAAYNNDNNRTGNQPDGDRSDGGGDGLDGGGGNRREELS